MNTAQEVPKTPTTFITIGTSTGANVTNINAGNVIMGDHVENNMPSEQDSIQLYPDFVVPDAGYQGSGTRSRCLEGTREAVVRIILEWKDDINASAIGWVSGPAGFGKSAVAQTIAELSATAGTLAASFFFLRGAGGRSDFTRLITTLAFQITLSVPEAKPIIEKALRDDPTIPHQSIAEQLQNLVISPLMSLPAAHLPTRPLIVVIDGLDECNGKLAIQNFIGILASAGSSGTPLLRWLLTSRGESHIRQAFSDDVTCAETMSFVLESFGAREDISKYLKSRFATILKRNPRLFKDLPLPWPSLEDLDILEQKSAGVFLFASTLVEFVTDGKAPPDEKLQTVLNLHAGLDPLYEQVLRAVPEIECFPAVLTTLMLVQKQPSVNLLADLLQLGTRDVLHALLAIQSIIYIPIDNDTRIELNHSSLRDFLVDKDQSGDLFIDPSMAQLTLAVECVQLINRTLRQDEFHTDVAPKYAAQYALIHLGNSHVHSEVSPEMLSALTDLSSSEVLSVVFDMIAGTGEYIEITSALAQSLEEYTQIQGSGAIVRVLQKINIQLKVNPLIAPILCC